MFHLVSLFAVSSEDHACVPIPALALQLHQRPSSTSGRASLPSWQQQQPPPKCLRMLQRRGTGTQRGSSVTLPGWGQRHNHLHPSSAQQNHTNLELSLLLAQRGGRK